MNILGIPLQDWRIALILVLFVVGLMFILNGYYVRKTRRFNKRLIDLLLKEIHKHSVVTPLMDTGSVCYCVMVCEQCGDVPLIDTNFTTNTGWICNACGKRVWRKGT